MHTEDIKQHLEKVVKILKFYLSGTPKLVEILENSAYIAGGAVRDLYFDETPKDYDFFFSSVEALRKFKASAVSIPKTSNGNICIDHAGYLFNIILDEKFCGQLPTNFFDFNFNIGMYELTTEFLYLPPTLCTKVACILDHSYRSEPDKAFSMLYRMMKFQQKGFKFSTTDILDVMIATVNNTQHIGGPSTLRDVLSHASSDDVIFENDYPWFNNKSSIDTIPF